MEAKPCSRCSHPASFSFCVLLSTVGVRPRTQQSSKSVSLCQSCLEQLIASLAKPQPQLFNQFTASFSTIEARRFLPLHSTYSDTSKENP